MKSVEEIIKENRLSIIECCILFELDKYYPKFESVYIIDMKMSQIQHYLNRLIDKGLVERRFQKYRIVR
uniref:Uncharacterized protein n=1 Tax=Virgibacillus oceani TaxID=1479511 RepID=A0A917H204_9BACI|nr:hypothetical protein GCM10011398_05650 [Virgibacillus oceani]